MNSNISKKNVGILALSLFMLSTAPIFVKLATVHPLILLFWRLLLVSALLIPFFIFKIKSFPKLKDLKYTFFIGLFLVGHFYTWFKGIPLLPVAVATIIYSTNPVYTAIISFFLLKEPYKIKYAISFLICLLGIFITLKKQIMNSSLSLISIEGIIYMITTSIFYSFYITLSKKIRLSQEESKGNSEFNFFLNLLSCLIVLVIILFINFIQTRTFYNPIHLHAFPSNNWFPIIGLAIFPSLLGHVLMVYSVTKNNINYIGVFKLVCPLISSILAYIVFDEKIFSEHILGLLIVTLGVFITTKNFKFL